MLPGSNARRFSTGVISRGFDFRRRNEAMFQAREAAGRLLGVEVEPGWAARQLPSYHDVIGYDMDVPEYALELLLAYDGRLHYFASGHYLKFEVKAVPHRGGRHVRRRPEADHWHRAMGDKGRPYEFVSVERLLEDFFGEAERVLREQGVAFEIVTEKEG